MKLRGKGAKSVGASQQRKLLYGCDQDHGKTRPKAQRLDKSQVVSPALAFSRFFRLQFAFSAAWLCCMCTSVPLLAKSVKMTTYHCV